MQGSIHLYAYSQNDPVDFVDPLGLFGIDLKRNYAKNPIGGKNQSLIDLTGPFGRVCGAEGTALATWIPDSTPEACRDNDDCYDECAREYKGEKCRLKCDRDLQNENLTYGGFTKKYGKKAYDDASNSRIKPHCSLKTGV